MADKIISLALFLFLVPLAMLDSILYSVHADSLSDRWLSWANSPNIGSKELFLVNVTVNDLAFNYVPVDTGSTGFLISAKDMNYKDDSELKKCCKPAFEFLSSSRRYYEGYWLPSNLTFTAATGRSLTSSIPVFAVTESGNCSSFKDGHCTKDLVRKMPSGTKYMGVGFGRWSKEQPDATADKNALLNIDFGSETVVMRGYVINQQGLMLGLRPEDLADGWTMTKLTQNKANSVALERPEWNGTPMCVSVATGPCHQGTVLFDTGISYAFLGITPEATQGINETVGKTLLLKKGVEMAINVHSSQDYSFRVGDFDKVPQITPESVHIVHEHSNGAFVNTGRYFFNGFSLLFDEVNGVVGLKKVPADEKLDNEEEL